MKIAFLRHFYKDLKKITIESIKRDVADVIINTEKASKISEINNIKKLTGFKNAYRIKIGDYRIGIFIENDLVEFARLIHRKDIYKVFP
ncbi:MAG: plasmid stabilization protein [Bacteroidetes bacterium CG2_30_32_10]|nr:MAG: plasmid stabilization protein [Bacteroidetes bacterium CG2_30_32_10]